MRVKSVLIAGILVAFLAFSSCASNNRIFNIDVSCEEFDQISSNLANDFEINKGDSIRAKLCANPSTGFTWDYVIDNDEVVKMDKHEFVEAEGDLVGAPGVDVWTFKAIAPGEAVVKLEYSQLWEGGTKAAQSYTLTVKVLEPVK